MANEKNTASEADERVYTLSRPFDFEGETITELTLDFGRLVGDDLLKVDKIIAGDSSAQSFVKALSMPYQLHIAALAANKPYEIFAKMPAKDVSKIALRAQSFLLG
ncbi:MULTISPECIES: phage tail assembly protein [unclassified Paenibacillus]|uniref:phage tail assembly protein n=1 Tax=unclassified Paenibacillus TaxID=185978 RepID=UPI0024064C82|nr:MULTISPECIES: phage tail assembly protein [unclassified Paenibacillus]MDF9845567.1 hypothetical protein [Paenibacillus sp. PastF-2]MDF9852157.1 hypothetical protein [Paenibacillus sp. PastM-2]MDF9858736.1 hypothetical protein [Paenibacillus sp. PastF-1]MDH6483992.1 hypothetical protein [Paenibacillus sp. PastH-2]MDH6511376.1 hypothetical protein [Paenibacillus sp. PastM-3]